MEVLPAGDPAPVRLSLPVAAGLAALCLVAFAPGLTSPMVQYDDELYLTKNPVMVVAGWQGLQQVFSSTRAWTGQFVEFFPLRDAVYWGLVQVWGFAATPFHIASLAFHILASLLVFLFVSRLGAGRNVTLATAILFAVHPIHIESVTWVAGLKDPMYTSAQLASVILWQCYRQRPRPALFAGSLLLLVAALSIKSMALVTPLLLCAVERFTGPRRPLHQTLKALVPHALISALFFLQFVLIARMNNVFTPLHGGSLQSHIVLASWAQVLYLKQALLPATFRLIYCFDTPSSLFDWRMGVAVAVATSLLALLVRWRARPLRLLGAAWYFICLLPVSNVLPFLAIMADRYLYAASIGSCLVVALLIEGLQPRLYKVVSIIAVVALTVTTMMRTSIWQDQELLWQEPDEDPACMTEWAAWATNSHLLRARATKDLPTRLAALERAIETPMMKATNTYVFMCSIYNAAAMTALELELHDKAQRYSQHAGAFCRNSLETWSVQTMVYLHREPRLALQAARRAYRIDMSPANALLVSLMMLETTRDERLGAVIDRQVQVESQTTCAQLELWATEVEPALRQLTEAATQRCARRSPVTSP